MAHQNCVCILARIASIFVFVKLLCLPTSGALDPLFEPETMADSHGNSADRDSTIEWGPLPTRVPYKTDSDYSAQGLQPLYNFANSFIDTVQPNDFPYDIAAGMKNNSKYVSENSDKIAEYMMGFFVCVALGLLFAIAMPVTGIIFCCCRTCGNCGGKMVQKPSDNRALYRHCYGFALAVSTIFLGVGMICTYVTNDRMSDAIEDVESQIGSNLNDMVTYLDNTINELESVTRVNYNFTAQVIARDLQNIDYLVGIPVRETIDTEANVLTTLDNVLQLTDSIETVSTDLFHINDLLELTKRNGEFLIRELSRVRSDIESTLSDASCVGCERIEPDQLVMQVNFSHLPSIQDELSSMQSVLDQDLAITVEEAKQDFLNIPERVYNETALTVQNTENMLAEFYETVDEEVANVEDLPIEIRDEAMHIQDRMKDYHNDVEHYNEFRWGVGVSLTCMVLMIVILQTSGIILGSGCHDEKVLPTERSWTSHCGGCLLLAAMTFIFMFSWLLMLLCTLSLLVGGNIQKLVCEPILDPEYTVIKKLLDSNTSVLGPPGEYYMGKVILGNASIELTLSGLLQGCKQNKPAYEVLKLNSLFDLNTIVDYNKSIDIETEINNIEVDFTDFDILTPTLQNQLKNFSNATAIDYDGFKTELAKDTTTTDLLDFAESLKTAGRTSSDPSRTKLNQAARHIEEIHNGIYKTVRDDQAQLLSDITALQSSTSEIPSEIDDTIEQLNSLEFDVKNIASGIIKQKTSLMADRILNTANSFSENAKQSIESDIGRCEPLWNLYQSLFQNSICKYSIDAFNGFWFSLSWCVVFMIPSVIFNVKLAKHYRRMKYLDTYDDINKVQPGDM